MIEKIYHLDSNEKVQRVEWKVKLSMNKTVKMLMIIFLYTAFFVGIFLTFVGLGYRPEIIILILGVEVVLWVIFYHYTLAEFGKYR